jgi:hypothetical protein
VICSPCATVKHESLQGLVSVGLQLCPRCGIMRHCFAELGSAEQILWQQKHDNIRRLHEQEADFLMRVEGAPVKVNPYFKSRGA